MGRLVARLRGDLSQTELADRMRRRGHRWSQSTVWAVEKGSRPLKHAEAVDLVAVLGAQVHDLEGDASAIEDQIRSAAYQRSADDVREAIRRSLELQLSIAEVSDRWGVELPRSDYSASVMGPPVVLQEELLIALGRTRDMNGGRALDATVTPRPPR